MSYDLAKGSETLVGFGPRKVFKGAKGGMHIRTLVRRLAKRDNYSVPEKLWEAMREQLEQAAEGNLKSTMFVVDKLCPEPKEAPANVNVSQNVAQATSVTSGPPVPEAASFGAYVEKLSDVVANLGLDETPSTLEDLMS